MAPCKLHINKSTDNRRIIEVFQSKIVNPINGIVQTTFISYSILSTALFYYIIMKMFY